MKSLAAKIFLLILFFILLPIYVSFLIIKISYERYLSRELSGRVSANIRRGEEELYDTLHTMANISNVFVGNEDLLLILDNPGADYYSRNRRFDSIVNTIYVNNLFDLNNVKITLLDTSERVYGNWSLNFNDYRFLLSESWVKESIQNKTHISWSLFSPSFVKQESEQYISLARSLLLPFPAGERVGTLLVSLNQRKINAILSKYGMETDFVYICTRDTMEEVFT
ncbi:MAG: hypothetical protein LBS57_00620, partial [Treponema sp.]|nr:hypothetical protein [Treponema sp.]